MIPDKQNTPFQELEDKQKKTLVQQVLKQMDEDERSILLLFYFEDWKVKELADLVGKLQLDEMLKINFSLTKVLASVVFYIVIYGFVISSLNQLKMQSVSDGLAQIMTYLPTLFSATLMALLGLFMAQMAKKMVKGMADATGNSHGMIMTNLAQGLIMFFVGIMVLEQLGIETDIITDNVSTLFWALAGIAALGIGLGGRDVFGNLLAGNYAKKMLKIGDTISVGDITGEVTEINAVSILLKTSTGTVMIPSNKLMQGEYLKK